MKAHLLFAVGGMLAYSLLPASGAGKHGLNKEEAKKLSTVVTPKALSGNVNRGLTWLASNQLKSGGWGQGDESQEMGSSLQALSRTATVGDTCAAALAFIRAGQTPAKGQYKDQVKKAVE